MGGGFGSKGTPRPDVVLAAMAARQTGRPVTVALPRRYLPAVVGHRAPTLHRLRLGARADGGEIGIVGTAAAIGNAVHHAYGVRLRELPLTPDRVLGAAVSGRP